MTNHYLLKVKHLKELVRLNYNTNQFSDSLINDKDTNLDFWDVGVFSGNHKLKKPLHCSFYNENKNNLSHFLPTTLSIPFVISDYLYNMFLKQNITGIDKYDLIIKDKTRKELKLKYVGLIITGRINSSPDWKKSQIINDAKRPNIKYYKGLMYDWNKWDNSDFCLELDQYGGGHNDRVLITEKVARLLNDMNIRNILIEHCEDYFSSKSAIDFLNKTVNKLTK